MDSITKKIMQRSESTKRDRRGKIISFSALALIAGIVILIFAFVMSRGMATFLENKVSFTDFMFGTTWNPSVVNPHTHQPYVGALPMILGSFLVTFLAAIVATPFAIGTALFMTEIAQKRGAKIMQPVIELLVGIPSVVYGFIGLNVIVPFMRDTVGGSGFGILSGTIVLFVMILPTVTSMTVDTLKSVPRHYRESALAIGATRWQMIYKVVLRAATPGILTAIVFGMARAFGEALAVQMVIGNAALMPTSLTTPASTLTSVLTMGIGNTVMGSLQNNVLWTLAMILLLMSLIFNLLIRLIGRKGELK
ncbi:phosphate ABC transporter permease subunit PstC [Eupransor demetentiae]|uniref:Phosphate transport system permease protein n=1 Tax=Eupransor demetentiae TaxID=3109584 RepID=A0ABM9N513_9LACO|nr:ABC-type phosphate transport system [Lactobacillaceae bacterium LMG 33000]